MKIFETFCFTISEEWSERSSKFWVVRLTRAELPVGKKTFATSALSSVQKEFWAKFTGLWFMSSVRIDLDFKYKDEKVIYHLWFWQKSFMNLGFSLVLWNNEAKIFQVKKLAAYLYHQFWRSFNRKSSLDPNEFFLTLSVWSSRLGHYQTFCKNCDKKSSIR